MDPDETGVEVGAAMHQVSSPKVVRKVKRLRG